MSLNETFHSYLELLRCAFDAEKTFGPEDKRTITAYFKANEKKLKLQKDIIHAQEVLESKEQNDGDS